MESKKAEKETSIAVKETQALAAPSDFQVDFGDFDASQLIIPRIDLLQALSKGVQEDGDKQGTLKNNITGQNYGETVLFIPLKIRTGALYFVEGEGLQCKSDNGIVNVTGTKCIECPFGEYYKNWKGNTPPKCNETITAIGILADDFSPCVITFKTSSFKTGKTFASAVSLNRGKPKAYRFGATKQQGPKGTYFSWSLKGQVDLTPDQLIQAKEWAEQFKTAKVSVSEADV